MIWVEPGNHTMQSITLFPRPPDVIVTIPFTTRGDKGAPVFALSLNCAGDMGHDRPESVKNRNVLLERLGVSPGSCAALYQVHSKEVREIRGPGTFPDGEGDGLFTSNDTVSLSITVADCLPVALFSEKPFCYGLLHSGWKGTGIVHSFIEQIIAVHGIPPETLHAVIGPGIGPCCYHVDEQRAECFRDTWGADTVQTRDGRYYLDLPGANINILHRAGVEHITLVENCTCCNTRFGSFRRQGADRFTRMVALLGYFK